MAERTTERWPDYAAVPKRLSFVPGTALNEFKLETAEATVADVVAIRRICHLAGVHVGERQVLRWVTLTGFTVRVVKRSGRYIVALSVIEPRVEADENRILAFWAHPDYHATALPLQLLQLARLEMPEFQSVLRIAPDAKDTIDLLLGAGWIDVSDHDTTDPSDTSRREFRIRPAARREYCAALTKGSTVRPPTGKRE